MNRSVSRLASKIRTLQKKGKKVVFTNGCFDLIHAGHVRLLRQAKKFGDFLVVAVNSDSSVRRLKGKGGPILPLDDRMEILKSLSFVDAVVPFSEETPLQIIKTLLPDVLVKGGDYSRTTMVGADVVKARKGRVISGLYVPGKSTTKIINQIKRIP